MSKRKSPAELRALAEQTQQGQLIRAQQKFLNAQEDLYSAHLENVETTLEKIREQQHRLIDRFHYLTLCVDEGKEYSEEGYERYRLFYELTAMPKYIVLNLAKNLEVPTRKRPIDEVINDILAKPPEEVNTLINKDKPNV